MFTPRTYQIAAAIGIVFILILSTYCAPPNSENKDTVEKKDAIITDNALSFAASYPQLADGEGLTSSNIDSYLYKLRNSILEDAVKTGMNLDRAKWIELPPHLIQGDRLHNMINPSSPNGRRIKKDTTHFNAIWYNHKAAQVLNKFIEKPEIPKVGINYPDSTLIVQFESVLDHLEGAFKWDILIDTSGNTAPSPPNLLPDDFEPCKSFVWLKRISISYKDPNLRWVYAAFSYDKDAKIDEPCASCKDSYSGLNKLAPVGAEWKTPFGITSIFSNNNKSIQGEFRGIEGKLTSPGNAGLPCAYCHSAAQWNVEIDSLNDPSVLTHYFTGAIHKTVSTNDLPLLFNLNTPEYAYCNPANSTNTKIDSIISKICPDPGDNWVSLDDDLLLTIAAMNALMAKSHGGPPHK